jgi:polyhydroxybutyrate depolymerase
LLHLALGWWYRPGLTRFVTVGNRQRRFHVHLPNGHDPKPPKPVVLALHGATTNGPMLAGFTGLNRKADEAGFLAVYPDGTGSAGSFFWNGGTSGLPAEVQAADDVAFVAAVLDDLARAFPVDAGRVFVTGISNGAVLAYRLAAELAGRIAAIAPVAGTLPGVPCRPGRPVSVLHVHGTEDEFIPFHGGVGRKSLFKADYASVATTVRTWVEANGCAEPPVVDNLTPPGAELPVTRTTYGGGKGGAEVVLVTVEGGGHTWPGRPAPTLLGRSTQAVSANDLLWEFFQKHARP